MGEIELIDALRRLDQPVAPPDDVREAIWHFSRRSVRNRAPPNCASAKAWCNAAHQWSADHGRCGGSGPHRRARCRVTGPWRRSHSRARSPHFDPRGHPVAQLVADGIPTYELAVDKLSAGNDPYLCSQGEQGNWALCLVYSDGILAIVTFDNPDGTVAFIQGGGLGGEVRVPIDGSRVVGFASSGGEVTVTVERDGEFAGSAQGMRATSSGEAAEVPDGVVPVPEDHLAARLIADDAAPEEVIAAASACARGGSAVGPISLCLVDDEGLLVLVPLSINSGVDAAITGSALAQEFDVSLPAVSRGSLPQTEDLFAIPHAVGSVNVELFYLGQQAGASIGGRFGS